MLAGKSSRPTPRNNAARLVRAPTKNPIVSANLGAAKVCFGIREFGWATKGASVAARKKIKRPQRGHTGADRSYISLASLVAATEPLRGRPPATIRYLIWSGGVKTRLRNQQLT